MAKKAIHLTENELKQMIYEEVKEAFDKSKNHEIIDISEIDIDILKSAYYDLRLTPTITVYGDILSNLPSINEGVGDILPPDTVVKNLIKKYGLPPQLVLKREAFNKIYIYVITALIGKNDKLIEQDMRKMGYFLGYRQPPQTINGMIYQVLQFVLIPPVFEPFKTGATCVKDEKHENAVKLLNLIIEYDIQNWEEWVWIEASGKIEEIFRKYGGFNVPTKYVKIFLRSIPFDLVDEYHYSRNIGGNMETKTIFGFKDESTFEFLKKEITDKVNAFINGTKINESLSNSEEEIEQIWNRFSKNENEIEK